MSTPLEMAQYFYSEDYRTQCAVVDAKSPQNGDFSTHLCSTAEMIHTISEGLFIPLRGFLQQLASVVEPLPGENKEHVLWGIATRVTCLLISLAILPAALVFTPLALIFRAIEHAYRPAISLIDHRKEPESIKPLATADIPLQIRTQNLGFTPTFLSIIGDLRDPEIRAQEIVASLLADDLAPDMIFFQEAFHEDAVKILCEGLKQEYPYIVHHVAPNFLGLNSGNVVLSKYPLKEIEFECLKGMLTPEKLAPRGVLRVRLEIEDKPDIFIYSVHTQALLGHDRALARLEQLEQIKEKMERDAADFPHIKQIVLGDFNTSQLTAWGENNQNQPERAVLDKFDEYFDDPFLKDHDKLTGERLEGTKSQYLESDNERMGFIVNGPPEPSGSWYYGPFADKGSLLRLKAWSDKFWYGYPEFGATVVEMEPPTWGTSDWWAQQTAKTARFDYFLFPKDQMGLEATVEIRRLHVNSKAPSAPSDHLPVDGQFWFAEV